ncbi:MAG: DUF2059 domain-containing protein [Alphaproteobacteria bacterium]
MKILHLRTLASLLVLGAMLVVGSFQAFTAVAQGTSTSSGDGFIKADIERDVDKLLELTDVDVTLAFINDGQARLLEDGKKNGAISKDSWPYLDEALKTAFAPERLKRIVRKSYVDHVDPAQLPGMLTWFGSDAGRKITAAQNRVMNRAGEKALFAYRDNPQSAPPSEARLKILRRINELSRASENQDLILQNMQKIFVDGFTFYRKNSTAEVASITKLITESRAKALQRVILGMAYIFRELDDRTLEQQIEFLESPAGKNFVANANIVERALWDDIHKNHLLLMMGQMIGKLDPP